MAAPSRFDRRYELTVDTGTGAAVVIRNLRLAFSVDKSVSGGLNKMTARIENLTESNRLALTKDVEDSTKLIRAVLRVGYGDDLRQIFQGTVQRGATSREGAALVAEIECLDGGFDILNGFTSRTVRGGAKPVDAILTDLPNTRRGKIREGQALTRPKVLVGASARLLDSLVGEGETWFIDDGGLYLVREDEVVSSFVPVVAANTGLLNTPSREQSRITFDTLMNPTLRLGGLCEVRSANAPHLDGIYRIDSMSYTGDTHGADWSQTCTGLLMPSYTVL